MLNALYLMIIILTGSGQGIVQKPYTKRTGGKGTFFFNTIISAAALLFFVITSSGLHFEAGILPYSIVFAVAYATASVATVLGIAWGSLSLTLLFVAYSLIMPTLYGLIFLKDPVGFGFVPGLILLFTSIFLINVKKGEEKEKFSLKWIVCVIIAFLGNGVCTVTQKMQQVAFDGAYKNEFMIAALGMVFVTLLAMSLLKERKEIKVYARAGAHLALICGLLNGAVNLFVMILSARMPVAIMFPLVSAGRLIVTYLASRFLYKEALSRNQFIGFLLGMAAVVCLNL